MSRDAEDKKGPRDTQHNDIQRNDIQHKDTQHKGLIKGLYVSLSISCTQP